MDDVDLQSILESPAPMLERLRVRLFRTLFVPSIALRLTPEKHGHLRDIDFLNLSIGGWDPAVLTGLRSLHLIFPSPPSPSLQQTYDILQASPLLETLELKCYHDQPDDTCAPTSLHLPSLKNLTLRRLPPTYLHTLLASIDAPACSHLTILFLMPEEYTSPRSLDRFLPAAERTLLLSGGMTLSIGHQSLVLEDTAPSTTSKLDITFILHTPLDPLQWVIDTFAHILVSLPVKVTLTEDLRCDTQSDQLISTLGRMDGVTELKVEKGASSFNRLLGYMPKPDERGEWPFPNLHTLEILATELVLTRPQRPCRVPHGEGTLHGRRNIRNGSPVAFKRLAFTDLPKWSFAEIQAVVGADNTENLADSSDDEDDDESDD